MRTNKTLAALLGSATLVMSGYALADSISSSEIAPIHKVLPEAYGDIQFRHKLKNKADNRTEASADSVITAGSMFFKGDLRVEGTTGVKHHTDTDTVEQKSTDLEIYARALGNDTASLQFFNENTFFKNKDRRSERESQIGIFVPVEVVQSTSLGTVTLGGGLKAGALLYSQAQQTNVGNTDAMDSEDRDLLSLTDSGERATEQRSLTSKQQAYGEVKFQPNSAAGLSLQLKVARKNTSTPIHKYDAKKDQIVVKEGQNGMAAYNNNMSTVSRIRVKYDVTQNLFVQNDLLVYSARDKDNRYTYTNVLGLGAKLF